MSPTLVSWIVDPVGAYQPVQKGEGWNVSFLRHIDCSKDKPMKPCMSMETLKLCLNQAPLFHTASNIELKRGLGTRVKFIILQHMYMISVMMVKPYWIFTHFSCVLQGVFPFEQGFKGSVDEIHRHHWGHYIDGYLLFLCLFGSYHWGVQS